MTRYAAGDTAAFETLYARHKDALYRYLARGCGNGGAGAELFQDVWMRVIRARKRYRASSRFRVWLYTVAHNRLVDYYRRQRPGGELPEMAAPEHDQPQAQASRQQAAERVRAALARLPFEQREAILLKEEQDLSVAEIAAVTRVGRETAKSRLRYGLAKLRQELCDDDA